jgi:hypothetical protein
MIAMIFFFSMGQNLIVVNWVRYGFAIDSLPELLFVALVKSAPLLLTMGVLWRHAGEVLQSHAAWSTSDHTEARRHGGSTVTTDQHGGGEARRS